MKENFTIIALGSNLGDRLSNLRSGFESLKSKIDVKATSYIYSSKAQLPENSPKEWDLEFYNCVFYGNTQLNSSELLEFCSAIEQKTGKKYKGSWSPRILDIDIIAFNNEVIDTESLKLPHPLMHKRNFVLFPLADILPEWQHPVLNKTTLEMIKDINHQDKIAKSELKL